MKGGVKDVRRESSDHDSRKTTPGSERTLTRSKREHSRSDIIMIGNVIRKEKGRSSPYRWLRVVTCCLNLEHGVHNLQL
jgi:hypothetical protein